MDLKQIARKRGTTLNKVARACEIPASTLYAISSGETTLSNVGVSTFLKIADALGVDADQLYIWMECGNDVDVAYSIVHIDDHVDETLSNDEYELVRMYRAMDKRARADLLAIANTLSPRVSDADTNEHVA